MTNLDLKTRFMNRVELGPDGPFGPCWIWLGRDGNVHREFPTPRGIERLKGRFHMDGHQFPAYVAAWIIFKGLFQECNKVRRQFFCHTYRCVNPDHLELGFQLPETPGMKDFYDDLNRGPGRPRLPENKLEKSYDGIARNGLPPLLSEESSEEDRHSRIAERSAIIAARRRGEN